ncbi:MAG: DUF192 domain-containing protein [Pseudomonadota bacterium]|nr:DUF192 domain-containing protein [Pseudomonadota bacterium]
MIKFAIPFAAYLIVGFCLSGSLRAQSLTQYVSFPKSSLTINVRGRMHKFQIELALNQRQHAQGLMFRRRLPRDEGMLFVYKSSSPVAMWMKNTLLSLDILFIKIGGAITKIVERTVPMSETKILSDGSVIAVLELNAGTTDRLGIRVGDFVRASVLRDSR